MNDPGKDLLNEIFDPKHPTGQAELVRQIEQAQYEAGKIKDDLQFILMTPGWPRWPYLFMKNYAEPGKYRAGFIYAPGFDSLPLQFCPDINLFDEPDVIKTKISEHPPTVLHTEKDILAVLFQGWRVD